MPVTMKDIAKELGISRPTVNEILRGRTGRYHSATCRRVKEQAKKMGYRPNLLARGLVQGKTRTIGFLTGSPGLEVVSAMATKLDDYAESAGYEIYTAHTKADLELTVKRANKLIARGVDGLIIRGSFQSDSPDELKAELDFPIPTVIVSLDISIPFACRQVHEDESVGTKQAVDHLYKLGHRQIYMLRSEWGQWEKSLRFTGFYEAMKSHGLGDGRQRLIKVCEQGYTNEDGHSLLNADEISSNIEKFLKAHPDCTAIICTGDEMALHILSFLSRLGIRVPQDISVVGFSNIPATLSCNPPLSTVARPIRKTVRAAFDMLMEGIEKNNFNPRKVVIPTEFIIRQSTGTARQN